MKTTSIVSMIAVLCLSLSAGSALAGPKKGTKAAPIAKVKRLQRKGIAPGRKIVKRRQVRQAQRIRAGIKKGQLTKREAKALIKQQRRIQKAKKRMIQNDSTLNRKERRALKRKQNRASRNIKRARHNRRTP